MQSRTEAIGESDGIVLAISVDPVERNREVADHYGLTFPLLADPELRVIDAYGLRHVGGGLEGDIARPAIFVVDRDGRIVWRDLTENWRVRARPERIVERIRALP